VKLQLNGLDKAHVLAWLDSELDELAKDDGTEVYAFPGFDENNKPTTFALKPTAFRACLGALKARLHHRAAP
jgi:hypothetical protein